MSKGEALPLTVPHLVPVYVVWCDDLHGTRLACSLATQDGQALSQVVSKAGNAAGTTVNAAVVPNRGSLQSAYSTMN